MSLLDDVLCLPIVSFQGHILIEKKNWKELQIVGCQKTESDFVRLAHSTRTACAQNAAHSPREFPKCFAVLNF